MGCGNTIRISGVVSGHLGEKLVGKWRKEL
jgi:hypothetical protein